MLNVLHLFTGYTFTIPHTGAWVYLLNIVALAGSIVGQLTYNDGRVTIKAR